MDISFNDIHISIMREPQIYNSQRFRTPLQAERQAGLWVDRIGSRVDSNNKSVRLRVLGLYGAVYIQEGEGRFYSESAGKVNVGAGNVMLLFPDEPHLYFPDYRWRTQWIVWSGPDAENLDKLGYLRRSESVVEDSMGYVGDAFVKLSGLIGSEDIAAVLERKTIVLGMVLNLFKSARASDGDSNSARIAKQASEYLQVRYNQDISIQELAERFHLSPCHFRRIFKQYTGRSPREFVTAVRISQAKSLLAGGRAVKEVASVVGYQDVFYFMRIFKKTAGMTTGEFRKRSD